MHQIEETEGEKKFAQFWEIQLRKLDKGHARKAWKKAIKLKPADDIIEAYKRFIQWAKANNKEPEFLPYPATWLNGERWDDDFGNNSAPAKPISDADRWRARLAKFKATGFWPPNCGANPKSPYCEAPRTILIELGMVT